MVSCVLAGQLYLVYSAAPTCSNPLSCILPQLSVSCCIASGDTSTGSLFSCPQTPDTMALDCAIMIQTGIDENHIAKIIVTYRLIASCNYAFECNDHGYI